MISGVLLCLVVLPAGAYELKEGVTPVQKVIQLLQDMAAKGRQEKQDEEKSFSAYKQFCDDTVRNKENSIKDANAQIEQLQADIQKAESDAAVLSDKIAKLDGEIGSWEADKKAQQEIRAAEHADYKTTHADYSESNDALERAIVILKRQAHDRKQAAPELMQVARLAKVPAAVKTTIFSFLNADTEVQGIDVSAPQANAYEFQSGGVVDMLEKLKEKFADERNTLEKEEMEAKHASDMMVQSLVDSIEAAEQERNRHASTKAQRLEDSADAKGSLGDTTAMRNEDQKYMDTLIAQCRTKSEEFQARQQLRAEEIEAITKAIEIMSSGAVTGNADKHLPALVQSFAQLRASKTGSPVQKSAAAFLQGRADKLQSRILSLVASKVASDPFEKVRKMIKDMVVRLMEEANDEAEHKGWCDTELTSNKQTRDTKTQQVESLTAEVDGLTADIAKLSEEISDLTKSIAEIDAAVAEATAVRNDEKAKNAVTVKDAKDGSTAVAQAVAVLKEFYASAAEATALVQQQEADDADPAADSPGTWDSSFKGQQGASGGVLGMLEVIQSDFARLEAETSSSEDAAQNEYDRFSAESAEDKAVKSTDLSHKDRSRTTKERDLNDTKKDLKGTQGELDAALAYFEKLKPSCVDSGLSYEDRVKRREEEIQSLQEALRILSGDDIA